MKKIFVSFVVAFGLMMIFTVSALATCSFQFGTNSMDLQSDCTTDTAIVVPNGVTLDGNGFTITGVDPSGDHFKGAVVINGGEVAHVTNLKLTVSGLVNVCDASADRLRGIMFVGASGSITNNTVFGINQGESGCQEGNAIEVRNFGESPSTSRVTVDGNAVSAYQKTGIVANGNVDVTITNNEVNGGSPVGYIARNGIQVGFGGTGMVKRNTVNGNAYTGSSTASGGVLVVGGPGYGGDFCVGVQVMQNNLSGNDVGVYISQYEANFSAPSQQTNIKVVNNTITNNAVTNGYPYQAGVSDVGNNDKIINNTISGAGYATNNTTLFKIDADAFFTNRPRVHANK